jgi:hypothetical protein
LFSLIEEGESILERGIEKTMRWEKSLIDCVSKERMSNSVCEFDRSELSDAYAQVAEDWDFDALQAEMQSIRFGDGQSESSRARDAYVDHLDAWNAYLVERLRNLPSETEFVGLQADKKVSVWYEIIADGDAAISRTFKESCSALGNAQPSNSDQYKARIIDLCDD